MRDSKIVISGLKVFAFHGCLPEERARGQNFFIDVEVEYDFSAAASSDALDDAVDYNRLANELHAIASTETYDLLETLVMRLGDHILADPRISAAVVRVHKPEAPFDQEVAKVAAEARFERPEKEH